MRFHHRFEVRAPREKVTAFHRHAASLAEITPLVPLRFLETPPVRFSRGDELRFELRLWPLRVRWRAKIEAAGEDGFVDVQAEGPFRSWRHVHRFEAITPEVTAVVDDIEARLSPRPGRAFVGLVIWLGLPLMFALRGRATRRRLEEKA
jgi:ligand-binding SRPBCC domain-containing protein